MAIHIDTTDENAIVFSGFENGIADDPYSGISDMRNVNIISIPGEASVNFSTGLDSDSSFQGVSVISADAIANTITLSAPTALQTGQAIYFTVVNSGDASVGTANAGAWYWIEVINSTTLKLYTSPVRSIVTILTISVTWTGTFSTVDMALPKYFAYDSKLGFTYLVDSNGRVWSNWDPVSDLISYFAFTGNKVPTNYKAGNGLVIYASSDPTYRYLFVFHDSSIDYASLDLYPTWVYQWKWNTDGSAAGYNAASSTDYLHTPRNTHNSHEAIVATDNRVYFCDANWIDSFYQTDSTVAFDPTNTTTYTHDTFSILPFSDTAQCLTQLGTNLLIGGKKNIIYPWDRFSTTNSYPILLAESNVQKMVTVNTNAYALLGNRGRIYITNGSQATMWKKIPDHISNTVEPYFTWGGLCSQKNQIYFSFLAETNQGGEIDTYGGIWACDVDTEALRLTNKLSYDTYNGYASALIPNFATNPAGTGLFIGWYDGDSTYGVDQTVSSLYTNNQAEIQTELVNIGTFYRPKEFKTVEYKLTTPLSVGESVSIYYRKIFGDTWILIHTFTDVGEISGNWPVNFDNAQWIQLKIILNSI